MGSYNFDDNRAAWIYLGSESKQDLEAELDAKVQARMDQGDFSDHNVKYIAKVKLDLTEGGLRLPEKRLEKLRRLCQLWDVDIRVREISSHRKIIGPLIVAVKKLVYPVLRVFLRDYIRQQRSFNAGVIALLAELSNEKTNGRTK
jgi:hypothetical protein